MFSGFSLYMKFSHIADCHIGSWREPKMRELNMEAFIKAVDISIEKAADFVIISGDLFNTSFPDMDSLKTTVTKLRELNQNNIPVYIVAGSHDYSPSGKTILDVLEEAGLFVNVFKGSVEETKLKLDFTTDKKTGAKLTGIPGKRGMIEKKYYESLVTENLEKELGFKIFLFHTALSEFKPEELDKMDAAPLSLLPKHFNYYAGGHVHYIFEKNEKDYGLIVYPGPVFPNNFSELEKLKTGGFYFYEEGKTEYVPVKVININSVNIDANYKDAKKIEEEILKWINDKEFHNTVVLIKVNGELASGKTSDVDFKNIFDLCYAKSAYFVMKNTHNFSSREFEMVKVQENSIEELEKRTIMENLGKVKVDFDEQKIVEELLHVLNLEREETEKVADFERKIKEEIRKIIKA